MYEKYVTGGVISGAATQDKAVLYYKGIPYAAPPMGGLRFKRPQPPAAWEGVRECTEFSKSAEQPHQAPFMCWSKEFIIDTSLGYSEDCLYLNVWTGNDELTDKPVIVYIHGGGNNTGGASCKAYDGEQIARRGCVYVSINYRVCVLGFMAHPTLSKENDEHVSGNYALLDQIAALKWVRDNIAAFGGNPDNVTVAGQSAGSFDIHMLLHSPLSRGLIRRAVPMSFNPLRLKLPTLCDEEAHAVEIYGDISTESLRAMPPQELIGRWNISSPCRDGWVLPDDDAAGSCTVDIMTGLVDGDTALFSVLRTSHEGEEPKPLTRDVYEQSVREKFGTLSGECLRLYPAGENAQAACARLNLDGMIAGQYALAKTYPNARIWLYQFTHVMPGPEAAMWGAFHTADVPYWLGLLPDERKAWWQERDRILARIMPELLCSFARGGVPKAQGEEEWQCFDAAAPAYYEIGDEMHMRHMDADKLALWQNFYEKNI